MNAELTQQWLGAFLSLRSWVMSTDCPISSFMYARHVCSVKYPKMCSSIRMNMSHQESSKADIYICGNIFSLICKAWHILHRDVPLTLPVVFRTDVHREGEIGVVFAVLNIPVTDPAITTCLVPVGGVDIHGTIQATVAQGGPVASCPIHQKMQKIGLFLAKNLVQLIVILCTRVLL